MAAVLADEAKNKDPNIERAEILIEAIRSTPGSLAEQSPARQRIIVTMILARLILTIEFWMPARFQPASE